MLCQRCNGKIDDPFKPCPHCGKKNKFPLPELMIDTRFNHQPHIYIKALKIVSFLCLATSVLSFLYFIVMIIFYKLSEKVYLYDISEIIDFKFLLSLIFVMAGGVAFWAVLRSLASITQSYEEISELMMKEYNSK